MRGKRLILIAIVLLILTNLEAQSFSATEYVGDPRAVKGGQLTLNIPDFPKSFNYYVNNASDAASVFGLVYDSLLEMNPNTLEFYPLIAKSWTISPDKKEFTFTLDPAAKWADGKPITAGDVKFTYDTIMNPKNLTSVQRTSLSRFTPPLVVNEGTVKFTAKTVHYNNFITLAGLSILPQHLFAGKDFNKAFNMRLPAGSGPYILSEVQEGRYYILTRNKNYWALNFPQHRGMYNFDRIKIKVISENAAFEAFKKGDFDVYSGITAKRWVTETASKPFQYNWVIKQKVYNYTPQGFQGLAFNLRKPLFQDKNIRLAICHLIDRKTLLEKIMFNQYQPLTSYWPSLYGTGTANPMIEYNPSKAQELLKTAGFTSLDHDGYFVNKRGERLEFTISYQGDSFERHLTLIKEDCKKAGVKVNLELLSWPTLLKKMDEFKFDTVVIAWSSGLFPDLEPAWHSKYANEIGSSNLTGYHNPEVDRLINSLPPLFDAPKRTEIIKKIDAIIYKESPYALFWGANYTRILYKNIFGMPKFIFPKYSDNSDNSTVISYWWLDSAKEKQYQEAVRKNQRLSGAPVEVNYDKLISK